MGAETAHAIVEAVRGGANRRAAFRLPVSCRVHASTDIAASVTPEWSSDGERGRSLVTITEDLSMTGTRLRLPAVLQRGVVLSLNIELHATVAEVVAEVMHSTPDPFGAHAGMRFTLVDPQTRAALTRFLAAEERRRLPNVRVMYSASCTPKGETDTIEGATEECTPGFVRMLAHRPITPGSAVSLNVTPSKARILLDGHVAACQRSGDMWSIAIQLDASDDVVAATWSSLLTELRSASR